MWSFRINQRKMELSYHFETKQQRAGEDRFQTSMLIEKQLLYLAVFDGHGGLQHKNHTVDYCQENLHLYLEMKLKQMKDRSNEKDVLNVIKESFLEFDRHMYNKNLVCGATCCMILIDFVHKCFYITNLGDSKCFICSPDGTIHYESKNHTPLIEQRRIELADCEARIVIQTFNNQDTSYVEVPIGGGLRVSRSFGDFLFKKTKKKSYCATEGAVSSLPVVDYFPLLKNQRFILSTDGPFDVQSQLTSQEFIDKFFLETTTETLQMNITKAVRNISARTTDDITIGMLIL